MASWQISRQPIRQGGAALLIVLAVATGTLALSQRQSWTRSDHDQAAFATGADVRVQTSQPLTAAQAGALTQLPGVRHAMPVASLTQPDTGGVTLALDAARAAQVTLLRADQSARPAAQLFARITPAARAGVALPADPGIRLTARLTGARLGPATVSVFVADGTGLVDQFSGGALPADGRDHTLAVALPAGLSAPRLTGVSLNYPLPEAKAKAPVSFTLERVSGEQTAGTVPGADLRGWPAVASSPVLAGLRQQRGASGPSALPAVTSRAAGGGAETVTFSPGYAENATGAVTAVTGQLALTPPAPTAIASLATQAYLNTTNTAVGSTVQTTVPATGGSATVSVKIVSVARTFPTVTGGGGGLVVDLGALQTVLLSQGALATAPVTQWWLATAGTPPGLAGHLPPGTAITSASGTAARLLANPLSAVPQQGLVAVAVAAAVLAITGFCVSIAAGIRQRRAESALLAALGVPPRGAAAQLCLEKLLLSVPAAAAGLVLGVVLAELLVPAITLTAAATTPVPPVLVEFGWAQTLTLALAVAVLPVLAAGLTIARRPDAAANLRTAESP